jgi:hypothetical protein
MLVYYLILKKIMDLNTQIYTINTSDDLLKFLGENKK